MSYIGNIFTTAIFTFLNALKYSKMLFLCFMHIIAKKKEKEKKMLIRNTVTLSKTKVPIVFIFYFAAMPEEPFLVPKEPFSQFL